MPEDVYDGVFRDLPRIEELDELVLGGPMSIGDVDQHAIINNEGTTAGAVRSPEVRSVGLKAARR